MRRRVAVCAVLGWALSACNCDDSSGRDAGPDAGVTDAGAPDAGLPDAGPVDSGAPDSGQTMSGNGDGGLDSGTEDAGPNPGIDAGVDAGVDAGCTYSSDGGVLIPDGGAVCITTGWLPWNLYYARAAADAGLPSTIWVRSFDGTVNQFVTTGSRPTISANGRLMGFLRDSTTGNGTAEGSRGDPWVRDLDTGVERKLFTNQDYVVFGALTPDAGAFVFDYLCGLEQAATDGTSSGAFPSWGGCYTDQPAVSPDGTQVAVRNLYTGMGIEDFTGANQRLLLGLAAGHVLSLPRWSTSQQWISYVDGPLDDFRGQARALQPDGGSDHALTSTDVCGDTLQVIGPAVFTPDDRWAVVAGTGSGITALYAIPTDPSAQVIRLCLPDGPPVIFSGGAGPLVADAG
jgi:hypothetical protein